jgi:hypothetical protein
MKTLITHLWQSGLIAVLCAAAVVTPIAVTTSCSKAQVITVITDITKFSPVVLNVLNLACAFTAAAALCATAGPALNKVIADLNAALAAYQAQVAAGGATLSAWQVLDDVFKTFESQTAAIFDLFRISGAASQAEANAVALSAMTLLSVIEALFPAPPAAVAGAERAPHAMPARVFASALPPGGIEFFNVSAWQKDYNKKISAAAKKNPTAKLVAVKVV